MLNRAMLRASTRNAAGFSLVERLIAVAVMTLVTSAGVFTTSTVLPTLRADAALEQMLLPLRRAWTMAVNQRRNFTVTERGTNDLVVI